MASLDGTGAMGMEGSRTRKTEDFAIYKQGLSSSQFDSYLLSTYCMLCIKQVHLALKGSLPHCHLLVILEIWVGKKENDKIFSTYNFFSFGFLQWWGVAFKKLKGKNIPTHIIFFEMCYKANEHS